MGQIANEKSVINRANIRQLSDTSANGLANYVPAAGEYILISSDNSMTSTGQGNFDSYVKGDGTTACKSLEVAKIDGGVYDEVFGSTTVVVTEEQQSVVAGYYNLNNPTISVNPATSSSGGYCAKISVSTGDKFKIYGKGGPSAATALWGTSNSSRSRIRRSATSLNGRTTPIEVVIEAGEAYLYVNLSSYDSTTDKILKVIETTTYNDGLVERVEDLEDNEVNVENNLNSTSSTNALSANQGRVLNEDINGVTTETQTDMELIANKYANTNNANVPSKPNLPDSQSAYCCYISDVTEGEVYRIYGKGNSGAVQLYALCDSSRNIVTKPNASMNTRSTGYDLTIPSGISILVVNLYEYDSTTDKVQKIGSQTSECVKTRLAALEDEDLVLTEKALPLTGKKFMFFGDSVTDFTYNGKGLVDYFAEASGATVYKAAIGGTRFSQRATPVDTPTSNTEAYAALDICNMVKAWCEADYTKQDAATTYLNDHTARVNALKNNPISGIDFVCIGGGTNDMSANASIGVATDNTFDTILGAINKMIELLLTANPKLKIYFYSPVVGYHGSGGRTDANWDDNHQFSSGKTKPEYIELFEARTRANHIPYINLYWTLGWNQTNFSQYYLDTDDHHPYKGFDVIGRRLYHQVLSLLE